MARDSRPLSPQTAVVLIQRTLGLRNPAKSWQARLPLVSFSLLVGLEVSRCSEGPVMFLSCWAFRTGCRSKGSWLRLQQVIFKQRVL